ncbi:MAG: hypothetical protein ABR530_04065 [Pyrinomonadaceae bacterium]
MIITLFGFYKSMPWFHLIFGVVVFFVFTTTGTYMRADFPDKDAIPQDLRILMRSRHIYILFSSLIHLGLGVYLQMRPRLPQRIFQYIGSSLLTIASGFLLWGFIIETYQLQHFSDISREGIYLSFAGILAHVVGGVQLPVRK